MPPRLWPLVNCGDRLETIGVEETFCISEEMGLKWTRSERRRVAISYRQIQNAFLRIMIERWNKKRTPCNTEFMKQVLPWFMRPGGRWANFSISSRCFFCLYSSWGVGAFVFAILWLTSIEDEIRGEDSSGKPLTAVIVHAAILTCTFRP